MEPKPPTLLLDVRVEDMRRLMGLIEAQQQAIRAYYRQHGPVADKTVLRLLDEAVIDATGPWHRYQLAVMRAETGLKLKRRSFPVRAWRSYKNYRDMGLRRVPAMRASFTVSMS